MGRPSDINIDVACSAEAVESVHVGGGVVKVAEGELYL
jgi:predicted PhzF superfamily epimerase YddE/YHI9